MENVIVSNEQGGEARTLINHPIVQHYQEEVAEDKIKMCPCDDYDVCDYDAS